MSLTKKRACFYISPENKQFFYGMAINEKERDILLAEPVIHSDVKQILSNAKKVIEGYPLQKIIKNKKDISLIEKILVSIDRI